MPPEQEVARSNRAGPTLEPRPRYARGFRRLVPAKMVPGKWCIPHYVDLDDIVVKLDKVAQAGSTGWRRARDRQNGLKRVGAGLVRSH